MTDEEQAVAAEKAPQDPYRTGALAIAILWMLLALIVGIVLMATTKDESYGGDAYTGIQNAVVVAVRGIGWLVIGSGVLGLIVALRKPSGRR